MAGERALTLEQVNEIRSNLDASLVGLARKFGVSRTCVNKCRCGKTYKDDVFIKVTNATPGIKPYQYDKKCPICRGVLITPRLIRDFVTPNEDEISMCWECTKKALAGMTTTRWGDVSYSAPNYLHEGADNRVSAHTMRIKRKE